MEKDGQYIKSLGIVLSSVDYQASTKLLTIYLFGLGKIIVRASGALRAGYKLKPATFVMAFGEFVLKDVKGKYYALEAFESVANFYDPSGDYKVYLAKCIFISFLNKYTDVENVNDNLALLVVKALQAIDRSDDSAEKYIAYYMIQILKISGYSLDFDSEEIKKSLNYGAIYNSDMHTLMTVSPFFNNDGGNYLSRKALLQIREFQKNEESFLEDIQSVKVESKQIFNYIYQLVLDNFSINLKLLLEYVGSIN